MILLLLAFLLVLLLLPVHGPAGTPDEGGTAIEEGESQEEAQRTTEGGLINKEYSGF